MSFLSWFGIIVGIVALALLIYAIVDSNKESYKTLEEVGRPKYAGQMTIPDTDYEPYAYLGDLGEDELNGQMTAPNTPFQSKYSGYLYRHRKRRPHISHRDRTIQ